MNSYLATYLISMIGLAILSIMLYIRWDFKADGPITRRHLLFTIGVVIVPVVNTLLALAIAIVWVVASFDNWIQSEPFKVVSDWLDKPWRQ